MVRTIETIDESSYETKSFKAKVSLLQEFWNKRDQKLIPSKQNQIGIKKQKFLAFYNLFSYVNEKDYTFDKMAAFKDGPLYTDINSFVKKYPNLFIEELEIDNEFKINEEESAVSLLMTEALSSETLSNLTHTLDLWKNNVNQKDDSIDETDITQSDKDKIRVLYNHYNFVKDNYELYKNSRTVIALDKRYKEQIINGYFAVVDSLYDEDDLLLITLHEGELIYG